MKESSKQKMQEKLLIYTVKNTPRLQFIFELMLRDISGITIELTHDATSFKLFDGAKLNYSDHQFSDELFIFSTRILFEKGIEDQQINVFDWKGIPVFFGTHPKYIIPFDPFAASFYLVSRYEEYLPHIKDEHMRFSPHQSIAYQRGFLNKPLVNIWCKEIATLISNKFPQLEIHKKNYKYISTFDIDSAYAYYEKGLMRHVGAFTLALFTFNFPKIIQRLKVLSGFESDPYDTYDYQLSIMEKYHLKQIYFILVGEYGEYDKNIPVEGSRKFQSLIKQLADYAEVGVHPSYASNSNPQFLNKELKRLNKVLKREVIQSRQHFLKVTFPNTFRKLLELDIKEDYSMGYASEIGFRASICSPFHFYDLDLDVETNLTFIPFMLMDGTMKDYMRLSPEEATLRAQQLVDEVKAVKGTFVTLWHNQSVSDRDEWKGWRKVYESIVEYASTPIKH